MKLTIKDLKTGKSYEVTEHGAVLGRDKKNCEIPVRDESVSKKHARIFAENGAWMLEDLGSSNGTFFEQQAIVQPVALYEGAILSLAQRQLKVIYFVADAAPVSEDTEVGSPIEAEDDDRDLDQMDLAPPDSHTAMDDEDPDDGDMEDEPAESPVAEDEPAPNFVVKKRPALETERRPSPVKRKPKVKSARAGSAENAQQAALLGSFFAGLAYTLKMVPLILFNPMGSIKKSTQEQDVEALEKLSLAAFIAPSLLTISALGSIFSFIATLVAGHFSFGILIPGLPIALVSGLIGAIIVGFIHHPVMNWIVEKLGGQSDPRSRTNYLAITMAASVWISVASGIGTLLAAIPLPFVGMLSPLLSLVATAISLFVAWTWLRYFSLVKWSEYVLLGLGALAIIGGLVSFVQIGIASVRGTASSSVSSSVGADSADSDKVDGLTKEQQETLAASRKSGTPKETLENMRQAFLQQNKAAKIAQNAADALNPDKDSADTEDTDEAEKVAAKDDGDLTKNSAKDEQDAENSDAQNAPDKNAKEDKKNAPAAQGILPRPERSQESSPYMEYAKRLDEIEQALKEHPELINKKRIRSSYSDLLKKHYDVRNSFKKKHVKAWEGKILARRRDLARYKASHRLVNKLYDMIFYQIKQ